MRSTIAATLSLALLHSVSAQSEAPLEKRFAPLGFGVGGMGPGASGCGSQNGLVNLGLLNDYNCGNGNGPIGGLPGQGCGAQGGAGPLGGLANIAALNSYNCNNGNGLPSPGGFGGLPLGGLGFKEAKGENES